MEKAVGTHIVVRIDRELQRNKSIISKSGLITAPQFEYMQYMLQYGEILSVGEGVTNPDIIAGRKAILHHSVEADDRHLFHTEANGDQIRWLNTVSPSFSYKMFGVLDEQGDIIPLEQFIFCDPEPPLEETMDYEEISFGTEGKFRVAAKKHTVDAENKVEMYIATLPPKEEQRKYVSPVISHVPPTETVLKPGMKIIAQDFTRYPIDLFDREYWILSREFILSIVE